MEYKIVIDQEKAKRYGLNKNQAALVCFCLRLSYWADPVKISGRTYYFIARSKVVQELPYFYRKEDTVRRAFNTLKRKKLIYYENKDERDYVSPTRRVEHWNSFGKTFAGEKRFGVSEKTFGKGDQALGPVKTGFLGKGAKKFPTDQYTINKKSDQYARARVDALDFLKEHDPVGLDNWQAEYKSRLKDFEKFKQDFNDTCRVEDLAFKPHIILGRLGKFTRNWIANGDKYDKNTDQSQPGYTGRKLL